MKGFVRPAAPRDIAELEKIENAADRLLIDFLHPARWDAAPTGEQRASMPGFVLVVGESTHGKAVGFVHVIAADGLAHLEQLSVLPDHSRRGLGRTLVEAAKTEAARRGYDRMTLRTYADVSWNAPFYATCGFAESTPDRDLDRRMGIEEERLGLNKYGRRIQMTAELQRPIEADD